MRSEELSQCIDHTCLRPDMTVVELEALCQEAIQYGFYSVCIPPAMVPMACQAVEGSRVKVATVIGFPLGGSTPMTKAREGREAVDHGAQELDMVLALWAVKSGHWDVVSEEIAGVVRAVRGAVVKVILETGLLNEQEIVRAASLAKEAGAHFVKTSTGFSKGGATPEVVRLLRETVGKDMGVKASGGIRDWQTAMAMLHAGANRLGTSSGVSILTGGRGQDPGY